LQQKEINFVKHLLNDEIIKISKYFITKQLLKIDMKNKLLTTTAIASLMVASGYASAQTTVSGNLNMNYRATSTKGDGGAGSQRNIGKETQINIANAGKTNIAGLNYAAGFSIEHDGNERATVTQHLAGMFNENVYLDFIMGNTTLTFGADHIQNPDAEITTLGGLYDVDDVVMSTARAPAAVTNANSNYQAYGVGLMQTIPGIGRLSFNYTPNYRDGSANSDTGTSNDGQIRGFDLGQQNPNSAYEVGFIGDFGVKGLQVRAFRAKVESPGDQSNSTGIYGKDLTGYKYGLSYNVGQITVAVQKSQQDSITTTAGSNSFTEADTKSLGLGFAVNKDLSLGYTLAKTKISRNSVSTNIEEKLQMLSASYSLGPIATSLQFAKGENVSAATAGADSDSVLLSFQTRF
jgi:hypothetical protein